MKQYIDLLKHVYTNGVIKTDRTGTGTKSVLGIDGGGFTVTTTDDK